MNSVIASSLAAARWRILLTPPQDGATNMASDVALMDRARTTRECVLRVYTWSKPTISLGRNQRVAGLYETARLRGLGLDVVRRPTGGRTILHDHEITYSVTGPVRDAGTLGVEYAWINELLLNALRSLGVRAELAKPARRESAPGAGACFARPARGEITVGGRKLVGSAQYRKDGALLQHGSVLLRDDQTKLRAMIDSADHDIAPPATLGEVLGAELAPAELGEALGDSLRRMTGSDPVPLAPSDISASAASHIGDFRDERWTWRA